jgi:hypothetical protein
MENARSQQPGSVRIAATALLGRCRIAAGSASTLQAPNASIATILHTDSLPALHCCLRWLVHWLGQSPRAALLVLVMHSSAPEAADVYRCVCIGVSMRALHPVLLPDALQHNRTKHNKCHHRDCRAAAPLVVEVICFPAPPCGRHEQAHVCHSVSTRCYVSNSTGTVPQQQARREKPAAFVRSP